MTAWALAACASSSDCFREEVFCAALVTDTQGVEDHGINQDAWVGLQQAKDNDLADQVDVIESVDSRDYLKNIAYFADRGYDIIFTAGIALEDATLQSADLAPDSVFAGLNQAFAESRPNLISITFPEDQMGFAAGVSAVRLTNTGSVAAICETSGIDAMRRTCEGFRAGVQYANEAGQTNVKASVIYRENGDREKLFMDEAWGYETANDLIRRGVDVIFAAGGGTGQGALKAASDFGVYALGAERDQGAALADSGLSVVASFYGQARLEVQEALRDVRAGKGDEIRVGLVQFTSLGPLFPQEWSGELALLLAELHAGNIQTGVEISR